MPDVLSALSSLRRPRLLIRAARYGMTDYCRERTLRRLIENAPSMAPEATVEKLMLAEAQVESDRQSGDAAYSVARHIELLIALMSEARLLGKRVQETNPA